MPFQEAHYYRQSMRKCWKKKRDTTADEKPGNTTEAEPVTTEGEEREEQASHLRFPRLHAWVALTVSSIVCLIPSTKRTEPGAELWVLIVTIVSAILSFLTSAVYCIRRCAPIFVDKWYEGIVALLVLLFWIGRF